MEAMQEYLEQRFGRFARTDQINSLLLECVAQALLAFAKHEIGAGVPRDVVNIRLQEFTKHMEQWRMEMLARWVRTRDNPDATSRCVH